MLSRKLSWGLSLLIAFVIACSPASASAAAQAAFELELAEQSGNTVQIKVKAKKLQDVYAYDLMFSFDSHRLKFIEAKSELAGMSVPPIIEGNRIRFAHTKVGRVKGVEGDAELAALTFERISGGAAIVEWHEAKLVDSDLEMKVHPVRSLISAKGPLNGDPFSDIAGHWAESVILDAVERGFINGYGDGTFRPQNHITRAEFTAVLVRALGLPTTLHGATDQPFADHENIPNWARPYVYAAAEAKLVNGYGDDTFRANERINRTEMAALLVRALDGVAGGAGADEVDAANDPEKPGYADAEDIPAWAAEEVAAATRAGLMQGKGQNRFAPNAYTVRAEAAAAIINLLEH